MSKQNNRGAYSNPSKDCKRAGYYDPVTPSVSRKVSYREPGKPESEAGQPMFGTALGRKDSDYGPRDAS